MPQSRKRRTGRRKPSRGQSAYHPSARGGGGRRRTWAKLVVVLMVLALVGAGAAYLFGPGRRGGAVGTEVTTASGLRYTDLAEGTGPSPRPGQTALMHYTGTLENGTQFDTSRDGDPPLSFTVGGSGIIQGWNEGVLTMKVGGRRRLVIPPALGYGAAGRPPTIPPNATLIFDVELVGVR